MGRVLLFLGRKQCFPVKALGRVFFGVLRSVASRLDPLLMKLPCPSDAISKCAPIGAFRLSQEAKDDLITIHQFSVHSIYDHLDGNTVDVVPIRN